MAPDRIERETTIAAPVERVWAVLTEAEHIGRWFADAGAEIDLRPGGALVMRWQRARHDPARVEAVEPPRRFAYRWTAHHAAQGAEPAEGNSTLVEFTLTPEGDGTRLRVVESGFASLATDEQARVKANYDDNAGGWAQMLAAGAEYARAGGGLTARARRPRCSPRWPTRPAGACSTLLAEHGEGTATTLAGELPVSRVAVVKHLAVLDRAGLVRGPPRGPRGPLHGADRSSSTRPPAGWPASRPQWDARLAAIKRMAEEP